MQTHATPLFRYACRLLHDEHAAQDVVQQVFIRFSQLEDAAKPATPATRSWLYRATHNKAVDWIRAEQRRRKAHNDHADLALAETAHKEATQRKHRHEDVMAHIQTLKENERAVLLLRLQEGLSYREISEVTGLSEGNVGYLLHHAVSTLSQHLAPTVSS